MRRRHRSSGKRETGGIRVDWPVAGAIAGANLVIFLLTHHGNLFGWGTAADRDSFYVATDTTVGIIVGFTITALAFFYTIEPGRRLAYVRRAGGQQLRRVWIGSLTAPLFAVGVLTLALLIDTPDVHDAGIRWIVEFALVMTVLRFSRLVWLFSNLLEVATDDSIDPPSAGSRLLVHGPRRTRAGGEPPPSTPRAAGVTG